METGFLWDRSTWVFSVENSSEFALRIHSQCIRYGLANRPCIS